MGLGTPFERVFIAQVIHPKKDEMEVEDEYDEIRRLVETLRGKVVGHMVQRRAHSHREFCLGPGKAEELGDICEAEDVDTVVVDGKLSPNQIANLEHETASHVMDRTELILEIFARRAKTAEAKIQVELAYLDYVHPKLNRSDNVRAKRGGLRGFGESALGKKIRTGRQRAAALRKELKKIETRREGRQKRRENADTVALMGYTNAGKSTLLNSLSGESLYADDRLFATLDTTTRRVHLCDNHFALVSDTVGFVRKLPHELIASFHSTLAEALASDLIIHVADASSPAIRHQMEAVTQTLRELQADDKETLLVMNKVDAIDQETADYLRSRHPSAIFLSAKTGEGLTELKAAIYENLSKLSDRKVAST